jgi:hypothetical protein
MAQYRYDSKTGHVFKGSKRIGWNNPDGYRYISLNGREHKEHRFIWFLMTGSWPIGQIDHINRVKSDNRFENLREVTARENQRNTGLRIDNSSGAKGVGFHPAHQKYYARARLKCGRKHLGYFDTLAAAASAYADAIGND